MKIGDKMEKCYFLKIPQWPDFENLGGHSHHQDVPKNPRAGHGTFFFIRITFSSHVGGVSYRLSPDYFQLNFGAMKNLSTEFGMTFTLGDQVQKACQDVLLVIL